MYGFSKRIFGLDVLRALAISMVLSSHILWLLPPSQSLTWTQFVIHFFGFWGVELFFVLSGFLIGHQLLKLVTNEKFLFSKVVTFLKRRWYRTLPNYFLALFVAWAVSYSLGYQVKYFLPYIFFMQNFCVPMPAFFPESWSLSVEEFAYIVTPLALYISSIVFKNNPKDMQFLKIVILLIFIFWLTKVFFHVHSPSNSMDIWNTHVKAVVIYRIDAILYGVLGAWIFVKFPTFWQKYKYISAFIGTALFSVLVFGLKPLKLTIEQSSWFWDSCYLPLTSLAFLCFFPLMQQWQSDNYWTKPIVFISKISYAIYLWHYSIIMQVFKYYIIGKQTFTAFQWVILILVYIFFVLLLSFFIYRFFEKPLTNLREQNAI